MYQPTIAQDRRLAPSIEIQEISKLRIDSDMWLDQINRIVWSDGSQVLAYDGYSTDTLYRSDSTIVMMSYRDNIITLACSSELVHIHLTSTQDIVSVTRSPLSGTPIYMNSDYLCTIDEHMRIDLVSLGNDNISRLPYVGDRPIELWVQEEDVFILGSVLYRYRIADGEWREVLTDLPNRRLYMKRIGHRLVYRTNDCLWLIDTDTGNRQKLTTDMRTELIRDIDYSGDVLLCLLMDGRLYVHSDRDWAVASKVSLRPGAHFIRVKGDRQLWIASRSGISRVSLDEKKVWSWQELGLSSAPLVVGTMGEQAFFITAHHLYYETHQGQMNQIALSNLDLDASTTIDCRRNLCLTANAESWRLIGLQDSSYSLRHESMKWIPMKLYLTSDSSVLAIDRSGHLHDIRWSRDSLYEDLLSSQKLSTLVDVKHVLTFDNGQALILTPQYVYLLDAQSRSRVYYKSEVVPIRQMAIWEGRIYLGCREQLTILAMAGIHDVTRHIEASHLGLRSVDFVFVHQHSLLICDDVTCVQYAIDALLNHRLTPLLSMDNRLLSEQLIHMDGTTWLAIDKGLSKWPAKLASEQHEFVSLRWSRQNLVRDTSHNKIWQLMWDQSNILHTQILGYQWELISQDTIRGTTKYATWERSLDKSGPYTFRVRAITSGGHSDWMNTSIYIEPDFIESRQGRLYAIIGVFALGAIVVGLLYYRQRRRQRMAVEEHRQLLHQLHTQQQALQLQLDPHFIFNTIQIIDAQIKVDPEKGRALLRRMSKLMRMTMKNSREDWIALEDELQYLHSYAEIQQLHRAFDYQSFVDIGQLSVQVPSMMLQPLLENAIYHGLKSGENPTIRLDIKLTGRILSCVVHNPVTSQSDDANTPHLGLSTQVINERLKVFAAQGYATKPYRLQIEDNIAVAEIGIPFRTIESEF